MDEYVKLCELDELFLKKAMIGRLAVFFLVLKLGVPVIKITLYLNLKAASS